ncbi:class I SAM-dependent methyltransferase [Streptomyces sp. NBC_01443]|uniref:class I SAM-dependent methyltransferase n=1 Tax=Streptomyces sp. NBC_01443 TaxID=2903868 RepID=UPI002255FA8C|nr:class I SAM-dependent methyltransferase [Streptomyces sp. NBC_01443]MCX4627068.1 class I SAM-dependent methyltransferase [Streptomyces sp. NBC_01443]
MTEQNLENFSLEHLNLEAVYQGYRGDAPVGILAPWDIADAQPAVIAAESAGQVSGDVIDVGCGLGDNAIFLASRGYRVTGIDGAPTAIQEAQKRARAKGLDVDFAVADATSLDGYENRFDTVIDSGLYHCLTEDNQRRYMDALYRATKPGARLHLLCFAEELPAVFPVAQRVSEKNLREIVGKQWNITLLRPVLYQTSLTPESIRQLISLAASETEDVSESLARFDPALSSNPIDSVELDEQGRIKAPVWQLAAERIG